MPGYVFFDYAKTGALTSHDFARDLLLCCQRAAQRCRIDVEVIDAMRIPIDPGVAIQDAVMTSLRNAVGAILFSSPSSTYLALELGTSVAWSKPVLVLQSAGEAPYTLARSAMALGQYLEFDPGRRSFQDWDQLQGGIQRWLDSLPENPRQAHPLNIDEHNALEVFLTAFYKALEDGNTGLSEENILNVQAQVTTINVQLQSPEPSRSVIREAIKVIGSYLTGVASGVGASYLYDLLPHIH